MPRLCIHNASLVSPEGESSGGVLVGDDGRIEAILKSGERATADTIVDADGRLLFAGFIDAHVHMRDPGFTHKEDFNSGTTAAACGGITTVMCMPNTSPPVDKKAGFDAALEAGNANAHVDFALQGAVCRSNLDGMAELWALGVSSLETLLSDAPADDCLDDPALLLDALSTAARLGARVGIYTGCQALVDAGLKRTRDQGRADWRAFIDARLPLGEAIGVSLLLEVASYTGASIVVRQTCTARGMELLRRAKANLPPDRIAVEATPHHLHLDETLVDVLGPLTQMVPPLRPAADRDATAAALMDGTVDFVGSDHAPHAPEEKDGADPWSTPGGAPGLDTIAPAVLDFACRGHIPFSRVAEVLGTRPAELFGIADRKGLLQPGRDGDLVLVDPTIEHTVGPEHVRSKAGRSVFEGTSLRGWPVLTVLRGRIIAEECKLVASTPRGRFVPRMHSHRSNHADQGR